jgi:hypothetical protein
MVVEYRLKRTLQCDVSLKSRRMAGWRSRRSNQVFTVIAATFSNSRSFKTAGSHYGSFPDCGFSLIFVYPFSITSPLSNRQAKIAQPLSSSVMKSKSILKSLLLLALVIGVSSYAFAQYRSQCIATTKTGNRCQNLAKPYSSYCRVHSPFSIRQSAPVKDD